VHRIFAVRYGLGAIIGQGSGMGRYR